MSEYFTQKWTGSTCTDWRKDLALDYITVTVCCCQYGRDACGMSVPISLPHHDASALQLNFLQKPAGSLVLWVGRKKTLKAQKMQSLLLSRCISPTLPSHTYLHACVLPIKGIWVIMRHFCKEGTPRKCRQRRAVSVKIRWKQDSSVCYEASALAMRDSMDVRADGGTLQHLS